MTVEILEAPTIEMQIVEAAAQMTSAEIQEQVDRLTEIADEWNSLAVDMRWKNGDIAKLYRRWAAAAEREATLWAEQ
jgi:hypothetical protein